MNAANAGPTVACASPETSSPPAQVLLMIYCFLAGIAVSQSRLLWVMPLASVAYLAVFLAVSTGLTACGAFHAGIA